MKITPTTKEQLVYYMLQNISLGTYDNKFLTNLQENLVSRKNPVTSNQADLLTKITLRYFKQFKKHEIDVNEMAMLPWSTQPILSSPQYTSAFCVVEDDVLKIRSPYNTEFISEIRKMPVTADWDKDTKTWSMPYCEVTAKHAIECITKNYEVINFCPVLTEVIDTFAKYETAQHWDPIYLKVNGNYMIACITKQIHEIVSNVTLDASPATLALLTSLGINISNEVVLDACATLDNTLSGHKLIDFATSMSSTIIDENCMDELALYLKEIKSDFVLIVDTYKEKNRVHTKKLHDLLTGMNVNTHLVTRQDKAELDFSSYNLPVIVNSSLWGVGSFSKIAKCKTVFLGNNKPIEIK